MNIAMNDSVLMRCMERFCNLHHEVEGRIQLESATSHSLPESFTCDILHGDVGKLSLMSQLIDGRDIGMIDRRGDLRFLNHLLAELRVGETVGMHDLEGDVPLQSQVLSLQYLAHAARAELGNNAVVCDDLANRRNPGVRVGGTLLRIHRCQEFGSGGGIDQRARLVPVQN